MRALGLQTIPLALIDVGERLRAVDENYAQLLAENIAQVGRLRQPIEVRRNDERFGLVAGGHRHRAVQILGWTEIDAFVYEADDDEARLAEIDENLVRHDLNPLDRAIFLFQRKELYERLNPQTKRGGDRRSKASKAHDEPLIGFARDTAERAGLSFATIKRSIAIARDLAPSIRSMIVGTSIARKQTELQALIRVPVDQQAAVVERILNGLAHSVSAARALVEGRRADVQTPDQRQLDRLLTAWLKAGPSARKSFLAFVKTNHEA